MKSNILQRNNTAKNLFYTENIWHLGC